MKSERRHELTTNALADWLGGIIEWIRPYQTTLLGIVLLATLCAVVVGLLIKRAHDQTAAAWHDLATPNPAAWDNLAKQQPTTPVGCLAGIRAGDQCLLNGWQERYVDQAKANQDLANAVDLYERVQRNASLPLLRERATFGLARALETQGKLVEAAKQYETLKTGTFADDATKRLKDLQNPETRAFYDHFAQFNPKPPSPDEAPMPTKSDLQRDSLIEPNSEPVVRDKSPVNEKGSKDTTTAEPATTPSSKSPPSPPSPSTTPSSKPSPAPSTTPSSKPSPSTLPSTTPPSQSPPAEKKK